MDIRYKMLCNYLDELWAIKGLTPQEDSEKKQFYAEIISNNHTQWIDIRKGNKLVGFLLIGTPPNCHPDANFYIEEAYIMPSYRRNRLMSLTVSEFVKNNKGIYCLFILKRNVPAQNFWQKIFTELGYTPYYLQDVGAGDEFCIQYGFKPKDFLL